MEIIKTKINDVLLIKPTPFEDNRGVINKHFDGNKMKELGLLNEVRESFFSTSYQNVLRGFHFQKNTTKILTLVSGTVFDVFYDLRKNSSTYGQYQTLLLNAHDGLSLYMPPGIAHAYLITSKDGATFNYLCSEAHAPGQEGGVHWKSFDIDWGVSDPIISERDRALEMFNSSIHSL